jgi:anti-anti-sigma factor
VDGKAARTFEVRPDADGVLLLFGEFDLAAMDDFLQVAMSVAGVRKETVLDLSGVDFVDSSGLRAILTLAKRIDGQAVVLRNPRKNVRHVIEISGLGGICGIRVEPSEA